MLCAHFWARNGALHFSVSWGPWVVWWFHSACLFLAELVREIRTLEVIIRGYSVIALYMCWGCAGDREGCRTVGLVVRF